MEFDRKGINDIEMSYADILWFAVDRNGNIVLANSLEGDVPRFVKEDKKKTEYLAQRLLGESSIAHARKFQLTENFIYFICNDPYDGKTYVRERLPEKPIHINDLDDDVKELLYNQTLEIDAKEDEQFII